MPITLYLQLSAVLLLLVWNLRTHLMHKKLKQFCINAKIRHKMYKMYLHLEMSNFNDLKLLLLLSFFKTHFLLFHVVQHRWGSAAIFSTSSQIGAAFPAALCGSRLPRSMTATWKPRSSESLLSEGCRGGRERVHVWPRNHWMTHHLHLIRRTHCLNDFLLSASRLI